MGAPLVSMSILAKRQCVNTNSNNIMTTTIEQSATNKQATQEVSFGNGRYSPMMQEAFKDIKRVFKLEDNHAERIARQIGSDYGAAEQRGIVTGKLGKANKDNLVTVATSSKVKGVHLTPALTVLYAIQFANEAGKYGFVAGTTEWKCNEVLANAVNEFAD